MIVSMAIASAIGLVIYPPLAAFELNNSFFNGFSINHVAGSWSSVIKYVSVVILSLLTCFAYHFVYTQWDFSFPIRLPLALLFGLICMTVLIFAIILLLIALAMIAGIWALFYGPGDR